MFSSFRVDGGNKKRFFENTSPNEIPRYKRLRTSEEQALTHALQAETAYHQHVVQQANQRYQALASLRAKAARLSAGPPYRPPPDSISCPKPPSEQGGADRQRVPGPNVACAGGVSFRGSLAGRGGTMEARRRIVKVPAARFPSPSRPLATRSFGQEDAELRNARMRLLRSALSGLEDLRKKADAAKNLQQTVRRSSQEEKETDQAKSNEEKKGEKSEESSPPALPPNSPQVNQMKPPKPQESRMPEFFKSQAQNRLTGISSFPPSRVGMVPRIPSNANKEAAEEEESDSSWDGQQRRKFPDSEDDIEEEEKEPKEEEESENFAGGSREGTEVEYFAGIESTGDVSSPGEEEEEEDSYYEARSSQMEQGDEGDSDSDGGNSEAYYSGEEGETKSQKKKEGGKAPKPQDSHPREEIHLDSTTSEDKVKESSPRSSSLKSPITSPGGVGLKVQRRGSLARSVSSRGSGESTTSSEESDNEEGVAKASSEAVEGSETPHRRSLKEVDDGHLGDYESGVEGPAKGSELEDTEGVMGDYESGVGIRGGTEDSDSTVEGCNAAKVESFEEEPNPRVRARSHSSQSNQPKRRDRSHFSNRSANRSDGSDGSEGWGSGSGQQSQSGSGDLATNEQLGDTSSSDSRPRGGSEDDRTPYSAQSDAGTRSVGDGTGDMSLSGEGPGTHSDAMAVGFVTPSGGSGDVVTPSAGSGERSGAKPSAPSFEDQRAENIESSQSSHHTSEDQDKDVEAEPKQIVPEVIVEVEDKGHESNFASDGQTSNIASVVVEQAGALGLQSNQDSLIVTVDNESEEERDLDSEAPGTPAFEGQEVDLSQDSMPKEEEMELDDAAEPFVVSEANAEQSQVKETIDSNNPAVMEVEESKSLDGSLSESDMPDFEGEEAYTITKTSNEEEVHPNSPGEEDVSAKGDSNEPSGTTLEGDMDTSQEIWIDEKQEDEQKESTKDNEEISTEIQISVDDIDSKKPSGPVRGSPTTESAEADIPEAEGTIENNEQQDNASVLLKRVLSNLQRVEAEKKDSEHEMVKDIQHHEEQLESNPEAAKTSESIPIEENDKGTSEKDAVEAENSPNKAMAVMSDKHDEYEGGQDQEAENEEEAETNPTGVEEQVADAPLQDEETGTGAVVTSPSITEQQASEEGGKEIKPNEEEAPIPKAENPIQRAKREAAEAAQRRAEEAATQLLRGKKSKTPPKKTPPKKTSPGKPPASPGISSTETSPARSSIADDEYLSETNEEHEEFTAEQIRKVKWAWLDRKDRERVVRASDRSFLSRADIKTLQEGKAPNQKVITLYLKEMQKKTTSEPSDSKEGSGEEDSDDQPRCTIVDTYFHSQVLGNDRIRAQKAKKYFLSEMDLESSDKLLVPVYDKKKGGWYLICINFSLRVVEIYDPFRLHVQETLENLAAFLQSLEEETDGEGVPNILEFPEQQNCEDLSSSEAFDLVDTGVLLLEYVSQACENRSPNDSQVEDCKILRMKKVLEILDSSGSQKGDEAFNSSVIQKDLEEPQTPKKRQATSKKDSVEPVTSSRKKSVQKKDSTEPGTPRRKLRRRK